MAAKAAPMTPMKVRMSEVIHRGCLFAKYTSAFLSTPFKTEVWILTDCSFMTDDVFLCENQKVFLNNYYICPIVFSIGNN